MTAKFPESMDLAMRNAGWIVGPSYASCGFRAGVHGMVYPDGSWMVLYGGMPVQAGRAAVLTEAPIEARDAAERVRR